jgi:hypothetical protein
VPDDDDSLAPACDCSAHVGHGRARSEFVARLGFAEAEVGGRLSCSEQRAREHDFWLDPIRPKAVSELPCLLVTRRCEGAQLIGLTRS